MPRRLAAPTQRHPCSGSFYASSSVPISIRNGCGSYTLVAMSRYYFDFRDNGRFVSDDAGIEFVSLEEAKVEASRAMTDFARDKLRGSVERTMVIEVRKDSGPVLRLTLRFEIEQVVPQ